MSTGCPQQLGKPIHPCVREADVLEHLHQERPSNGIKSLSKISFEQKGGLPMCMLKLSRCLDEIIAIMNRSSLEKADWKWCTRELIFGASLAASS
jgi:hypothetical protein